MERHFTATVYILDGDRVLLIHHRKLQKWLPPGGHVDPNETPAEAARREAYEETGMQINFIKQENIWINEPNAKSFERPYMCMIEDIPPHGTTPAHQHIDFIYLAEAAEGVVQMNHTETLGIRWFTMDEVDALQVGTDLFHDTKMAIRSIFSSHLS